MKSERAQHALHAAGAAEPAATGSVAQPHPDPSGVVIACPFCRGSCFCAKCDGRGTRTYRRGWLKWQSIVRVCRACEGSGDCALCEGRGIVRARPCAD